MFSTILFNHKKFGRITFHRVQNFYNQRHGEKHILYVTVVINDSHESYGYNLSTSLTHPLKQRIIS